MNETFDSAVNKDLICSETVQSSTPATLSGWLVGCHSFDFTVTEQDRFLILIPAGHTVT